MAGRVGGLEAGGTKFVCAVGTGPHDVWAEVRIATTTPEETIGSLLPALGSNDWMDTDLRRQVDAAFASGRLFRDHRAEIELQGAGRRRVNVGGSQIPLSSDVPLVLISLELVS